MKNKSILEVVHNTAKGLHDAGLVENQTMREFDVLCLPRVKVLTPKQIQEIRMAQGLSQPVFAAYLNTSPDTVKKWEARGKTNKRPNGAAMKLLNLVVMHGIDILGNPENFEIASTAPVKKAVRTKRA